MIDFQIIDFWNWFRKNSNKLDSTNYDKSLLKELDNTISNWGLSWEIGPGFVKENSLTISPNGTRNLLEQTNRIIQTAPALYEWEFYSSRQAKKNWDKAKLIDSGFEFDASSWLYVLLEYPDGKIEILVNANNLKSLDTNTKGLAVDLVLTNLLGEKRMMEELDFIDIVNEFESNKGVTEIQFLPDHLVRIKQGR